MNQQDHSKKSIEAAKFSPHPASPDRLGFLHDKVVQRSLVSHDGDETNSMPAIKDAENISPKICGTQRSNILDSDSSDESLNNLGAEITPSNSPTSADSGRRTGACRMGRLSIEDERSEERSHHRRGRGLLAAAPSPKRAASTELPRLSNKQTSSAQLSRNVRPAGSQVPTSIASRGARTQTRGTARRGNGPQALQNDPRDSGCRSYPTPQSTIVTVLKDDALSNGKTTFWPTRSAGQVTGGKLRFPELILQPDSSPISQDQLAAEVKGIYAGLVVVEAKCINIDAAQAANPACRLGPDQWQALIALHRTLLYEHHDFLMATQHPSATLALRGLATKYSMPARMWKHGIHAFLEVLRYRRPESQDYMLAFIYLAYQMMALLFETVPVFIDTWIECLGDLARYRMAIEEERETHTIWGGVAARWYTMASGRHPEIGRLYHHLGILERPSLRKFCLYAQSLTSEVPFPNARDSLSTLCGPIVQAGQSWNCGNNAVETSIVKFHAQVCCASDNSVVSKTASDALWQLSRQSTVMLQEIGVSLIISNVAALMELGSASNKVFQLFGRAIDESVPASERSESAAAHHENLKQCPVAGTRSTSLVYHFCYDIFNVLIRRPKDRQSLLDTLAPVHSIMVWLHSLCTLSSRLADDITDNTIAALMNPDRFSWVGLCDYLNILAPREPVDARTLDEAHQGTFTGTATDACAKRLPEDNTIRGLIWSHFYFPPGWFDGSTDDENDLCDGPTLQKSRVERVYWLGLYLAFHTKYIEVDVRLSYFYIPKATSPELATTVVPDLPSDRPGVFKQDLPHAQRSLADRARVQTGADTYSVAAGPRSNISSIPASHVKSLTKVRPDHYDAMIYDDDAVPGI